MSTIPKNCWGRRGMPEALKAQIAADYRQFGPRVAARLHGRNRETIRDIVRRMGVRLLPAPTRKAGSVCYKGEWFSPDKEGYLRSTRACARRPGAPVRVLHRLLWEEAHGPIPPGSLVIFRDGNRANCVLENLECHDRSAWRRDPRSHSANEWTAFQRREAELLQALDAAENAFLDDPVAHVGTVKAALDAIDAHQAKRPTMTVQEREKRVRRFRDIWAGYTPEQRAERQALTEERAEAGRIAKGRALIGDESRLALLDERTAAVLRLRFFEGLRPAELNARLGISEVNRKTLQSRGLRKLKRELRGL